MTFPVLLAFDTSGAFCTAAIHTGTIRKSRFEKMKRGQAESLMPMLKQLLSDQGLCFSDVDGIGVGIGPGNFAGIRISVSAARGLAFGLNIPSVGVSLLEAIAWGRDDLRLAVINAYQNGIYAQLFEKSQITSPCWCDLTDTSLDKIANGMNPIVIGSASDQVASLKGWTSAKSKMTQINAILQITGTRINQKTKKPTPLYLRPLNAKPNLKEPPKLLD
ncbi:MAG: tRNA (adenosine(37)-N6)-threonylcarbamoyltransferase complex dimerization subunit type 1 TsaB [Aestuariivita sp.]|nr:tRNA (adenosine(37)-N6)-threonylcarbamoyltransferase complex dimerization subunit type 1 TsaB [Aestuariivita sp.]